MPPRQQFRLLRVRGFVIMRTRFDWNLTITDAGELADPRYRSNPVDRCYFCKSNLYDRIRQLTKAPIASGANLDDLDDYRPGLVAARERDVVHPFVEAGFSKSAVRWLARLMMLEDLADLPAQPCLSSRIETAIEVREEDLAFIDAAEREAGDCCLRRRRYGAESPGLAWCWNSGRSGSGDRGSCCGTAYGGDMHAGWQALHRHQVIMCVVRPLYEPVA